MLIWLIIMKINTDLFFKCVSYDTYYILYSLTHSMFVHVCFSICSTNIFILYFYLHIYRCEHIDFHSISKFCLFSYFLHLSF